MDRFAFESVNFPGRFIRHRFAVGELSPKEEGPEEDFWFTLVSRGSDGVVPIVALRSVNFPDRFFRHKEFRLVLESPRGPGDLPFRHDSSFLMEKGLTDPEGVSFRSENFPDRFLRHRGFQLFVEPEDTPNLAADATFFRRSAPERDD